MNKIESFYLPKLHVGEYFQYLTSVDTLIVKYQAGELLLQNAYQPYKNALTAFDSVARIEIGSGKTDPIEVADTLRDRTWNACDTRVLAYEQSPLADEQESARALRRVFNQFGDIRRLPYNDETGLMSQLITNLLLPANAAHLQKVGLNTWVAELKKQNDAFQALFAARNSDSAAKSAAGKTADARRALDAAYADVVNIINASVVMKQSKPVALTFINEMNELIKYYKQVIASRNTRNGKSDATDQAAK